MKWNWQHWMGVAGCVLGWAWAGPLHGVDLSGVVTRVDKSKFILVLDQPGLTGVVPPGELTVRVGPGDLELYTPGMRLRGDLKKSEGVWRLETIWPHDPGQQRTLEQVNARLRADTVTRGRRVLRLEGDMLPEFALYDEEGRLRQTADFRGKYVILNFIFTRCPVPTMCPASTARMARLQRDIADKGWKNVELVSITLDPEYDTPGVLRYYATSRAIGLESFSFLTGPKPAVEDLLKQFGVLVMRSEGTLDHTMATVLADPNGKILFRREGSRWGVEDFLGELEKRLGVAP